MSISRNSTSAAPGDRVHAALLGLLGLVLVGQAALTAVGDQVLLAVEGIQSLLATVGVPGGPGPFTDARTVHLAGNHTVSGSPGRFTTGRVEVKADEAWREDMRAGARLVATALALPMLRRYGYRP